MKCNYDPILICKIAKWKRNEQSCEVRGTVRPGQYSLVGSDGVCDGCLGKSTKREQIRSDLTYCSERFGKQNTLSCIS